MFWYIYIRPMVFIDETLYFGGNSIVLIFLVKQSTDLMNAAFNRKSVNLYTHSVNDSCCSTTQGNKHCESN